MNQRETINLLNSIMPDIISSKDPEGTMLKCAEAHNLSPAQLEKLGQTFNTAKTIVGLEKQANRGDSFKIVDVPALITKYATYSPEKAISRKSQKVHDKVDQLFEDDQDGWSACITISKNASAVSGLPSLNALVSEMYSKMDSGLVDSTDEQVYELSSSNPAWSWEKSASSMRESEVYKSVTGDMRLAKEDIEQILFEAPIDIAEKCASIAHKLTPDEGRWAEAAADIHDAFGEKAASVISLIEGKFANMHHHFEAYEDFSKRASSRTLVQDRHNVFDTVKDIIALQEVFAKAASALPITDEDLLNAPTDEEGNPKVEIVPETINGSAEGKGEKAPRKAEDIPASKVEKKVPATTAIAESKPGTEVIKPGDDISALLDAMSSAVKNIPTVDDALNAKPINTLESLLHKLGPHSNSRAKAIDSALRQAQMDTTLQQLMLSDDVIASADPSEVQSVFKTLASISPTLATDPGKMGPALKEALQYGAVPINILTDAAKFEGQMAKNELDRSSVERNKYSL